MGFFMYCAMYPQILGRYKNGDEKVDSYNYYSLSLSYPLLANNF